MTSCVSDSLRIPAAYRRVPRLPGNGEPLGADALPAPGANRAGRVGPSFGPSPTANPAPKVEPDRHAPASRRGRARSLRAPWRGDRRALTRHRARPTGSRSASSRANRAGGERRAGLAAEHRGQAALALAAPRSARRPPPIARPSWPRSWPPARSARPSSPSGSTRRGSDSSRPAPGSSAPWRALSDRLVAIYKGETSTRSRFSSTPRATTTSTTRAELLRRIQEADQELAARVRELRAAVAGQARGRRGGSARAGAHNAEVDAARATDRHRPRAAPRRRRPPSPAPATSRRRPSASLQSQIAGWSDQVQEAARQLPPPRPQPRSRGWTGTGDWAIPAGDRHVRVRRQLRRASTPARAPAAPTRSCPRPGRSTAARACRRTPLRPSRTRSRPRSGPTPAAAPGSARARRARRPAECAGPRRRLPDRRRSPERRGPGSASTRA